MGAERAHRAAEGQRRGSGGAAAHLPTCAGRRIVKLAEPDLVREGKRVLGGVRGPKGVSELRFWKGEAEQSWPRLTSADTSVAVGEKISTPMMSSITKEMTLCDTFILSICAARHTAA